MVVSDTRVSGAVLGVGGKQERGGFVYIRLPVVSNSGRSNDAQDLSGDDVRVGTLDGPTVENSVEGTASKNETDRWQVLENRRMGANRV